MVTPVVGLERDGALRRGAGVELLATALEDEAKGRPRLRRLRIEAARLARVARRQRQRRFVRGRIGARHFELHRAGVGEADVGRGVIGRAAQRLFEHRPRAPHAIGLERFEQRAPFDECAMWREQRVECLVAFAGHHRRDRDREPISAARHRLDIAGAVGAGAENAPQT